MTFAHMAFSQNPVNITSSLYHNLQNILWVNLGVQLLLRKRLQTEAYAPHMATDKSNLAFSIHSKNLEHFNIESFT